MADLTALGDLQPLPAPVVQGSANLDIEGSVHRAIFPKFCASGNQHFAQWFTQSIAMPKKTLTQVLADRLKELTSTSGMSDTALAKKAGVSPNTVSNYKRLADELTIKGQPRSAELGKVERIAEALGVSPLQLLMPSDGIEKLPTQAGNAWPHHEVEFKRWTRLTERQKGIVEAAMNAAIDKIESAGGQHEGEIAA